MTGLTVTHSEFHPRPPHPAGPVPGVQRTPTANRTDYEKLRIIRETDGERPPEKGADMTANELRKRWRMDPHAENGAFIETHYRDDSGERPASGSIYYYVSPDEKTEFHVIDCDEYWCYAEGSPLEIWMFSPDGLSVKRLGTEEDCEPTVYIPKGTVFASRGTGGEDGTFLTCITVPRFCYEGFTMIGKEEMLRRHPQSAAFFGE